MNMLDTIVAKSDQLNADDLIGRTMDITIRDVKIAAGEDQPVSLYFEGDNNKPFKLCKTMRRVVVNVWGPDASAYKGRSMRVYRDPTVRFGPLEVGGIRISHMSNMERDMTMALTATKGAKKPFTVKPLKVEAPKDQGKPTITLKLLKPDGAELVAKDLPQWVEWCEYAIADATNASTLGRWQMGMAPHFLAAEHADVKAVEHVQKLAAERLDALASDFPGDAPSAEAAA